MKTFLIPAFFSICLFACSKETSPTSRESGTSKLELVWQKKYDDFLYQFFETKPPIWSNGLVVFPRYEVLYADIDSLRAYDAKPGALRWIWGDYRVETGRTLYFDYSLQNGQIIVNSQNSFYRISASTGAALWDNLFSAQGLRLDENNFHNHSLFGTHADVAYVASKMAYLLRLKEDSKKIDSVFVQPSIGGLYPLVHVPAVWTSPAGDEILLFQAGFSADLFGRATRTDFIAYNATQKQTYFRFDDIDPAKSGNRTPPYLSGNFLYVPFSNSIFCFDLINKKIGWSKEILQGGGLNSNYSPFIIAEGKLFVKPTSNALLALDPATGKELFASYNFSDGNYVAATAYPKGGCSLCGDTNLAYYNGVLYYTSPNGTIMAVDVKNYAKIWQEPSPNCYRNAFNNNILYVDVFINSGGVAIDTTLGYLYTSDRRFAMCLKLAR